MRGSGHPGSGNCFGISLRYALNARPTTSQGFASIKGRHELLFGFHFRYDQLNLLPDQQQIAGNNSWDTNSTYLYDPTTSRTQPGCTPYTGDSMATSTSGS